MANIQGDSNIKRDLTVARDVYLTGRNLGDTFYSDNSEVFTALPGNITTTQKFLSQTGTGSVSAAPSWQTINFVPYLGATQNVDLETFSLKTSQLNLLGSPTPTIYITQNGTGDMTFTDVNAGTKTLAELAVGGSQTPWTSNINSGGYSLSVLNNPSVNPTLLGYVVVGNNSNYVMTRGNYAYVIGSGASTLAILDVTNPNTPTIVNSISGLGNNVVGGKLSGDYVYCTNQDNQLNIISIQDPLNPSLVYQGSITGTSLFSGIEVVGNLAYVNDNSKVYEIDVSNPVLPTITRSVTAAAFGIYNLIVKDEYLYGFGGDGGIIRLSDFTVQNNYFLAVSGAISGKYAYITNGSSFSVVDVSVPSAPNIVGSIPAIIGTYYQVNDVQASGRYAYLSDTGGGNFFIIDCIDPTTPVLVGDIVAFPDISQGTQASCISGKYAYVVQDDPPFGFQIIELTGTEISNALIHSLQSDTGYIRDNLIVGNTLDVDNGAHIGGNLLVDNGIYANGVHSGQVLVKTTSPTVNIYGTDYTVENYVDQQTSDYISGNALLNYAASIHSDDTNSPSFTFLKSRGTASSPTVVQDGDSLGYISFSGYGGDTYKYVGGSFIQALVEGTPTDGSIPSNWIFYTSGSPALTLHADQSAEFSGNVLLDAGFKMLTGAGNGYALISDGAGVGTWQSGINNFLLLNQFTPQVIVNGAPIFDDGLKIGLYNSQSFNFNGSSYLTCANAITTQLSGGFTLSFWIQSSITPTYMGIWQLGTATALELDTGQLEFTDFTGNTVRGSITLTDGNPHLVVITWDGTVPMTATNMLYYVDGVKDTNTATHSAGVTPAYGTMLLGSDGTDPDFTGELDQIALYTVPQNQAWVTALWNGGAGRIITTGESNIEALWLGNHSAADGTTNHNGTWTGTEIYGYHLVVDSSVTASASITKDFSDNLTFYDPVTGAKTLAQLVQTVASVSATDSSLIISPTTGAVLAAINPNYSNIFGATQSIIPSASVPPTLVTSLANSGLGLALNGRVAYTIIGGTTTVYVQDFSDKSNPVDLGSVIFSGFYSLVWCRQGDYLLVTSVVSNGTFWVVDVSNPNAPTQVGNCSLVSSGTSASIVAYGNYAIISTNSESLVVDFRNPANPVQITGGTADSLVSMDTLGTYLYGVADDSTPLKIYSLDIFGGATFVGDSGSDLAGTKVKVVENLAYVVSDDHFMVFDIHNPATPTRIANVSTGSGNTCLDGTSRFAFVGNGTDRTVKIFDCVDPTTPVLAGTYTFASGHTPAELKVEGKYIYVLDNTGALLYMLEFAGIESASGVFGTLETTRLDVIKDSHFGGDIQAQGNVYGSRDVTAGWNVKAGNSLVLSPQTLGSKNDGSIWYHAANKSFATNINGLIQSPVQSLYTQINPVTIDSLDETSIIGTGNGNGEANLTLPDNFFADSGKMIDFEFNGLYSVQTYNITFNVYYNSTLLATGTANLASGDSSDNWSLKVRITALSAPSETASLMTNGQVIFTNGITALTNYFPLVCSIKDQGANVDTTVGGLLEITATLSDITGGEVFTTLQGSVTTLDALPPTSS